MGGEGYLTEAFTREAVAFIQENKDRPFFLYVAYYNVHAPYQVPKKYLPAAGIDPRRARIVGMIHALDLGVGRILDALDDNELAEDTLVIFLSDNGSPIESNNAPLSGGKATLWEGGVRVPFIFRWPGTIPPGQTYDHPVVQLDILPTAVALARGKLPSDREIDGKNVLPHLAGAETGEPHEMLFWRFAGRRTVRNGDLKLHLGPDGETKLFDVSSDIAEKHDLSSKRPDEVKQLTAAIEAWEARVSGGQQ